MLGALELKYANVHFFPHAAIVQPGLMLPGQIIAAQMAAEAVRFLMMDIYCRSPLFRLVSHSPLLSPLSCSCVTFLALPRISLSHSLRV